MRTRPPSSFVVPTAFVAAVLLAACGATTTHPTASSPLTEGPAVTGAEREDPALTRHRILQRIDQQIDLDASRAHLNARLALDEVMPVPYLGVDADPVDGGMKVAKVYPLTCAEASGVKPGDLLRSLGGMPVSSKATLGRAIRMNSVGSTVELKLVRDGAEMSLHPTIGPRPEEDEDIEEQFPDLPLAPVLSTGRIEWDFAKDAPGALPSGLEPMLGGHGEAPRFVVVADGDRKFLRQESDDITGIRFPQAIAKDFLVQDVVGRARFRFADGKIDRAGGVILRWRDPFNYLVARANAAEGDLRIFRVANGSRHTLPGGIVKAPLDDSAWHEIEFRAEGSKLTATLDGKYTTTAYDSWFMVGRVGVWTKADSITEFDDLTFESLSK